jgi:hypothetical protein
MTATYSKKRETRGSGARGGDFLPRQALSL